MTEPLTVPWSVPWSVLAERAVGWRQGPVAVLRPTPATLADVEVPSWAAQPGPFGDGDTAGGAGDSDEHARAAAIAELLERSAATRCRLEDEPADSLPPDEACWPLAEFSLHDAAQRSADGFPFASGYVRPPHARARTLLDGSPVWVPAGLVGLHGRYGLPATSTGLAADPSPVRALLRATQELVERDAFAMAWLHGVAPPRVPIPGELAGEVEARGGEIACLDLTPAHSPHPVAAVLGTLPVAGRPRHTLGLACRARWSDAVRKAWFEWVQGTVFVALRPAEACPRERVTDFDRHAVYYTATPDEWPELPVHHGPAGEPPPDSAAAGTGGAAELRELVSALAAAGIRLAHRDLTSAESAAVGLRVVRVLSPELVPLHADHNWPFLGGTARDVRRRFPTARTRPPFPNPYPHPLG
jgi:ribosomal protein S12 methylthiotransferase accessory factor